jgi:autotransporter translocation and assembly factor TamB
VIWRRLIFLTICTALLLGVGALLFSTPGLRLLTTILLPEDTRFESVSGRLIGPGRISGIAWSSEKLDVEIGHIAWGESPFSYFDRGVRIDTVSLTDVELEMIEEFVLVGKSIQIDSILTAVWIGSGGIGVEGLEVVDDLIVASGNFKMTRRPDLDISADIEWAIDAGEGTRWQGRSTAAGDLKVLAVSGEVVTPIQASIAGWLYEPAGAIPSYELALTIPTLQDAFGIDQIEGLSADILIRGTAAEVLGEGQLNLPALIDAPAELRATATSTGKNIDLDWTIALPNSVGASGTTNIDLTDGSPYLSAQVRTESMPATILHPELSGEFSTELSLNGQLEPEPSIAIQLITLDGTLNGEPLSGSGNVTGNRDEIRISDLDLAVGHNHLSADGLVGKIVDIDWRLDAPRIGDLVPGSSGEISGSGHFAGEMPTPAGEASLTIADLTWQDWRVEDGRLNARFDIAADTIERFELGLENVRSGDWVIDRVDGDVQGTPSDHAITLTVESGQINGDMDLHGSLSADEWVGRIEAMNVAEPVLGEWTLETPAAFRVGIEEQNLELSCLRSERSRVCFSESKVKRQPAQVSARVTNFPVAAFARWAADGYQYDGEVTANVEVQLPGRGRPIGRLQMSLDGLAITDDLLGQSVLGETDGTMTIASLDESIRLEFKLALPGSDEVEGQFQTGHTPGDELTGFLRGRIAGLDFIPMLFPQVAQVDGAIVIDAKLDGTRANPKFVGALTVEDGSATLLDPGITLRDIELAATANQSALNLRGGASSGEGSVSLIGELRWGNPLVGDLQITGERFRIADLSPTFIDVSPDLNATLSGRSITVRGDVFVDRANLAPIDVRMSVSPSPDQILIGVADEDRDQRFEIEADISVRLSDQIEIDAFGLTGTLNGNLQVQRAPRQPALARGTLAIKDGYFSTYGTNLDIERGRLIFSGGSIDNPGMDVRAERYVESLMAGVEVRGTLQDPKIRLVSDPPMTRHNMLALLVSGQPPENLGSASESLGMSSMGTSSQGALLGFDVGGISIGINRGESGEAGSNEKYLDYLNEITLRYRISRKWSVEASRGLQDTGVDVIRIIR